MDYAIQRTNMVESQIRPSDVTDRRIIRAMLETPREEFVPRPFRTLAYSDGAVRLTENSAARALLPPRTLAKLMQEADIAPGDDVLIVGSGTGYSAAIAARLGRRVVALECDETLAAESRRLLAEQGIGNVTVVKGALPNGCVEESPYDAVLIDGAISKEPSDLLHQLKDSGRLVAILAEGPASKAVIWRRQGPVFGSAVAFDAAADVLPGFETAPAFAF